MKTAILVKQVPQLSEVSFADGAMRWPDSGLIINPFDEYAAEEALRIKERVGGTSLAITFGKTSAEIALRDLLALGVDDAYLIASENFSATDPQTSARVLAAAIKKIGDIDLVLAGKQATDDDSALVPASVAAYLGWPQIGFVKKFDKIENGRIVAWRTTDDGYDVIESPLPAVCSVVKEINEPRLPSLKGKMKAKKAEIHRMTPEDLGINPGSSISIISVTAPKPRPLGEILIGDVDETVDKLVEKLKSDHLI